MEQLFEVNYPNISLWFQLIVLNLVRNLVFSGNSNSNRLNEYCMALESKITPQNWYTRNVFRAV